MSLLVSHGNYGGFVDYSRNAVCTDCHLEKNNDNFMFYKNRVNPTTKLCLYVNKKCMDCRRIYAKHKMMSVKQVKSLNIQRPVPSIYNPYLCDCCKKLIVTTRTIQLDHCHVKGEFRGWVCKECNISMGNLGDNIKGMIRVIKYMNKTEKYEIKEIVEMFILCMNIIEN
jgi:hypothetical protein